MLNSARQFANVSVKATMVNLAPRFLLELVMIGFVVILVFSSIFMQRSLAELVPLIGMFGVASLKLAPATTSIISGLSKMRFYRDAVNLVYQDISKTKETIISSSFKKHQTSLLNLYH